MTTSKQLIAYWRDSLTDAELAALELTEGNHVQVFSDALAEGTLDTQSTAALFAQSKQPIQLRDEPANIPIIVVPIVAVKAWRDRRQRLLCPLKHGGTPNLTLPAAVEAATALRESGAQVHVCRNIHSKVVCVDNEVFIEGSFNGLSAERSIADYTRYETSIIYTGPMAATFIEETLADIQQRIINETGHVQRT